MKRQESDSFIISNFQHIVVGALALAVIIFTVVYLVKQPAVKARQEKKIENAQSQKLLTAYGEQLLKELEDAYKRKDIATFEKLAQRLQALEQDGVDAIVKRLKTRDNIDFCYSLLRILEKMISPQTIAGLKDFYQNLKTDDKNYKLETIQTLSRMKAVDALVEIKTSEKDPDLVKVIETNMTMMDSKIDLVKVNHGNKVKEIESKRIEWERVSAVDAKGPDALPELKKALYESETSAASLMAIKKLQERGDSQSVEILKEYIKSDKSQDILRTNALVSLVNLKTNEARLAVKDIALTSDTKLQKEIIQIIVACHDTAMMPLLDNLAQNSTDETVRKEAETAIKKLRQ